MYEPGYISLYRSGELARRAKALEARLASCDICPRECHINRLEGEHGFCRSGRRPAVAAVCRHDGEEPAISGSRGSGTIFFGNCNQRCVYCQNNQISQPPSPQPAWETDYEGLAAGMLRLQDELRCHNINLVSPSHFVPQILRGLLEAVPRGLRLPLVYNTGSYDSIGSLQALDGVVDIYLADLRYASNRNAWRFSRVKRYLKHAHRAIREMYRQVGNLVLDDEGVARRGLIVRHLVLPNRLAGSEESLGWLAREISSDVTVSIMAQYYPAHRAAGIPLLSRRITTEEYAAVLGIADGLGLGNGWVQDVDASEEYRPDFTRDGHPFALSLPAIDLG